MQKLTEEQGNISILSVFAVVAVVGLYVVHDQHKTQNLRAEVLGSSLSSMASQANVAALARTKSLLTQNTSGAAAVTVQNNAFQWGSGSGFQIKQGALLLNAPDPRANAWISAASGPTTSSRVSVEKVEVDASGKPKALIAVAETTLVAGNASKSVKTRARFDLLAMNPPVTPPAASGSGSGGSGTGTSVAANPGSSGSSSGSTTLASHGSNPCAPAMGVGSSAASSQTGNNSSNSTAQGANTGTSATTTQNSAAGCSTSQTGGSSATAMSSGTGSQVTAQNSTTTTPSSSTANSSVSASGSGSVSASSSASASVGTGKK